MSYWELHDFFWDDAKVRQMPPRAKLVFIFLCSNRQAHQTGIYHLDLELIAKYTGLTQAEVDEALEHLTNGTEQVALDREHEIVWVRNRAGYWHGKKGGKISAQQVAGAVKHLQTLHKYLIVEEFIEKYPIFAEGYRKGVDRVCHRVSNGSAKGISPLAKLGPVSVPKALPVSKTKNKKLLTLNVGDSESGGSGVQRVRKGQSKTVQFLIKVKKAAQIKCPRCAGLGLVQSQLCECIRGKKRMALEATRRELKRKLGNDETTV